MKRIINGRRYDTDAKFTKEVASYSWGYRSDFQFYSEALYRTGHGNWFLAGEGGAMSKYAESLSDGSRGFGTDLIPMTPEQAMAWLETHDYNEAIEEYFGSEVQDA